MFEYFFKNNPSVVLCLSPPATGKTYALKNLALTYNLIYIAPLKALSLEFQKKFEAYSLLDLSLQERKSVLKNLPKKFHLTLTAELLEEDLIEYFQYKKCLFVLDEFHLFFYWNSFRPYLYYLLESLLAYNVSLLCLTATFPFFEKFFSLFSHYPHVYLLNFKNQDLGFKPFYHVFFSSRDLLILRLKIHLFFFQERSTLIFCQKREEVDECYHYLKKYFSYVFSCKGGETVSFQKKINNFLDKKVIIISTIALSHGVNLPSISHVFILYPVKNKDFWIQMVRRAGRDGKSYSIFSMDKFYPSSFFKDFLSLFKKKKVLSRDL